VPEWPVQTRDALACVACVRELLQRFELPFDMWAQVAKQSPPLSAERKLQICQSCVGHRVDLKLKSQQKDGPAETVQGIVYAAHGSLVILQEAGGIRLINVKYLAAPPTKLEKVITELDSGQSFDAGAQQALIEKFEVAKAKRERVLANRNPDAPALAQKIFDFLSKTYEHRICWS